MQRPTKAKVRRIAALVPLATLSAAWTASLVGSGAVTTASAPVAPSEVSASVPAEAIEVPASVSAPDEVAPGIGGTTAMIGPQAKQVVATSSASAIPGVALAAYQRAEAVINAADKTCNLSWQLIGAIGRVESNHGRYGGNVLDDKGIARPGIYGPQLNGKAGTTKIADTDAGQFDRDKAFDRAVGPMQFIPSTWSVVGVDADGDGQRNPQDINDAALATAVYLCSGNDDLSTTAGQEAAVYRYNHSHSYVNLVLAIMDAYASGDYTSVPNSVTAAGYLVRDTSPAQQTKPAKKHQPAKQTSSATPSSEPTSQASTKPSDGSGGKNNNSSKPKPGLLGIPGAPAVSVPALPSTGVKPVDGLLTFAQAVLQCTLDGYIDNLLVNNDKFDQCVKDYTGKS